MGLTSRAAPLPAPLCARMQAHIHYLHNDTFGNQGQPQIRDMQASLGGRPACGIALRGPAAAAADKLVFKLRRPDSLPPASPPAWTPFAALQAGLGWGSAGQGRARCWLLDWQVQLPVLYFPGHMV